MPPRLAPAFALAPLARPLPPAIIRDERTTDFFPRKSDHGSRKDTRPNTASVRGTWDFRSSLQGFVPAWLGCCCPLLHFAACLDTATDASRLHHTGQRIVPSLLITQICDKTRVRGSAHAVLLPACLAWPASLATRQTEQHLMNGLFSSASDRFDETAPHVQLL